MQDQNDTSSTASTPEVTGTDIPTQTETVVTTDSSSPAVETVTTEVPSAVPAVETVVAMSTTPTLLAKLNTPFVKQYGIAALIVLLMGGALWYLLEEQGRVQTGFFDAVKSFVLPEPAAIKVNGEKVPKSLYDKNYEQLSMQAAMQGTDVTTEEAAATIKQQAVDVLVNSTLLKQAAREAGIEVTDEQIMKRYEELVTSQGGAEQLEARMQELNITKENLIKDINDEILIQTHLSSAVDTSGITITDDDIKAFYDSVKSNPDIEIPPLEEVKDQIEQEIRFGKEQELIGQYLDTLKTDAEVEILI